jgi:hypothetical protein
MFLIKRETQLEETIALLQTELDTNLDREQCIKIAGELVKLHSLSSATKRQPVSADTLATIFANLAGILIIVKHEQVNVIASKALGFVQKLR